MEKPLTAPPDAAPQPHRASSSPASPTTPATWAVLFLCLYLAQGLVAVFWGRLTSDEGWYTLAAINVFKGMRPYRDFLISQMPLLFYVYGTILKLFGGGLLTARFFSLLLGLGSLILIGAAARRRSTPLAGLLAVALLALNRSFIFDVCSVKTQALTVFLSALSIYLLADPGKRPASLFGAIAAMNLAALSRLSLLPGLPLIWIYALLAQRRHRGWLLATLALNVLLLLAIFVYFNAGGNFLFGVYTSHQLYAQSSGWTWARTSGFFLKGWLANQLPLMLAALAALAILLRDVLQSQAGFPETRTGAAFLHANAFPLFLLACYGSMTAIHVLNANSFPVHQTSLVAFVTVFTAIVLGRVLASVPRATPGPVLAILIPLLVLAMPLQEWVVHLNGDGSLGRLRDAAQRIQSKARPGDRLLTLDAELSVASGLDLLPGYEEGQCSYFRDVSDEFARRRRCVNLNRLRQDLETRRARILCFDRNDLGTLAGGDKQGALALYQLIARRYDYAGAVEQYGQNASELNIFVAKP